MAHHVADEVASPARFRLLGRKGEVEVAQAEEVGMGHSRQGEGAALLLLADQAQGPARFSPDGVAAPFPAGEGDDRAPVALVAQDAGEGGDDPPIVVGMRAYEHHVDVHEVVARAAFERRLGTSRGRGPRPEEHRTQRRTGHREPSHHPRCLVPVYPSAAKERGGHARSYRITTRRRASPPAALASSSVRACPSVPRDNVVM